MTRESASYDPIDRDDEIDLAACVPTLWRWRYVIAAATVLGGLAAFVFARLTPPTFEARAQLIVTAPKTGDQVSAATALGVATFRALLDNQALASQVVREAGLEKPPYRLTPYRFLKECLTIQNLADTNIIAVRVALPDAAVAANVANRYAAKGVELARQVTQSETEDAQRVIKQQVTESRLALDGAEAKLAEFKRQAQVELIKKDVDGLLDERGQLMTLMIEVEGEKARLKKAEEELAKEEPLQRAPTALDLSAALDQTSAERTERDKAERGGGAGVSKGAPQFRSDAINPYMNPVHELLRQQVAMSRARVAALEGQRGELVARLKLDAPALARLSELYSRQMQLARFETEYDLARKVYTEAATRYENARLQVVGRTPQLQVFDQALAPERPIAPRPLRTTALGFVIGFVVSTVAALVVAVASSTSGRPAPSGTARVG